MRGVFSLVPIAPLLLAQACSSVSRDSLSLVREKNGFRVFRLEDGDGSRKLQGMLVDLVSDYDLGALRIRPNLLVMEHGRPFSAAREPNIYFFAKSRSTDYTADRTALLGTLVHEELHAYLDAFPEAVARAKADLKRAFPPSSLPRDARLLADDLDSTYLHLIVCWLEFDSLRKLVGEAAARTSISEAKMYRWIYDRVLDSEAKIRSAVTAAGFENLLSSSKTALRANHL